MKQTSRKTSGSRRYIQVFEIGLYLICSIALVYFAIKGVYSKCFQAGLIIAVLLLLRGLLRWTKTTLSPSLHFSVLLFITITMLVANLFNMYGVIPILDKIEHLLSGVILVYVGLLVLHKIIQRQGITDLPPRISIWFSLFFSIAMAACWEIYEFTVDHLFGLVSQNGSLTDTMWDIICGTIGAVCTVIYLNIKAKKNPQSIL
ncbi:hypothetical protein ACFQV5_15390 [Paenibacillus sp. GCM10028914]